MYKVVGETNVALNGKRSDVRSRETNLSKLLLESLSWMADKSFSRPTDLILSCGGGIRDTIQGPHITKMSLASAFAYDNSFVQLKLTGDEVLAALENAYSRYPSKDGRFGHIAGMKVVFDPTKKGLSDYSSLKNPSRIKEAYFVKKNGETVSFVKDYKRQVENQSSYMVVTNRFLASGGDGYKSFVGAYKSEKPEELALKERDIIIKYIHDVLKKKVSYKDNLKTSNVKPLK